MNRRFGFVSNVEIDEQKFYMKSMKLATIEKRGVEKVIEVYKENIETTSNTVRYCKNNDIKFYRMGDLFPFSTHPILSHFDYLNHFDDEIYELGKLIKYTDTRISIHSSPFCVLNSNNAETVKRAIIEIKKHAQFMDKLELPANNRIVVHTGGTEGGKDKAKKRFIDNFNALPENIKKRVVLENDDKVFSFKDVEDIHKQTGVPIVLDIFHHRVFNPENIEEVEALTRACATWKEGELPEIHYSSQEPEKAKGSHSTVLDVKELGVFLKTVAHLSFDVMLECKNTHQSAERAIRELGE
jgi:UV DNA damage endonuclease